jgi:hypothetical protein
MKSGGGCKRKAKKTQEMVTWKQGFSWFRLGGGWGLLAAVVLAALR